MLSAIIVMNEKNQSHYDAHCPRCRRANSISRQRMELFFPNWQDAARQKASMPEGDYTPPPLETEFASASSETAPLPKEKKAPAAKKPAASKPAEKKAPTKSKKK
jgi:hypothetical protein